MIAWICAAATVMPTPQGLRSTTIQVPERSEVQDVVLLDVDLDGEQDLVLSCRDRQSMVRSVQVHTRRADGGELFVQKPDRRHELDRSIVAFTFCDCDPQPGRELVLLTPTTAAALRTGPDGASGYRQLFQHALVWPAPWTRLALPLPDAVADVDGDGRDDLILPGPDSWTVWFQSDAQFEPVRFALPAWRNRISEAVSQRSDLARDRAFRLTASNGRQSVDDGVLVSTSARTAPCAIIDIDGDGRRDLVAQRNGALFIGAATEQRELAFTERDLPLPENRLKLVDPSFDVQWPDVNADGVPDLLLTTSAKRDEDVEARVDLFLSKSDGRWPARADRRLRMQPMAQPAQLVDADGDGRDDLACVTIRTSAMRAFGGGDSSALDAQLTIFANEGDVFARRPKLNVALPLSSGRRGRELLIRVRAGRDGALGDVVLVADGRLERRPLTSRGAKLGLGDADATVKLPEGARVDVLDDEADELVVVTRSEIRHVRFRR